MSCARLQSLLKLRLRQNHMVNRVDYAVFGQHIRNHNVAFAAALVGDFEGCIYCQRVALQRFDWGVYRHVGLQHQACNHVVRQHSGQ